METRVIVTAVIKHNELYLIGKRAANKKFAPDKWEFISGFIDTPESAEKTILREVKEETKLEGKIVKTATPYVLEDSDGRWVVIPFLIEAKSDSFVRNPKDHSELRWVNANELKTYHDLADLSELKKRKIF